MAILDDRAQPGKPGPTKDRAQGSWFAVRARAGRPKNSDALDAAFAAAGGGSRRVRASVRGRAAR
jgi:hypothetical protein